MPHQLKRVFSGSFVDGELWYEQEGGEEEERERGERGEGEGREGRERGREYKRD